MRSAVSLVSRPLFRRSWLIALVITLAVVIWGVSLSYAGGQDDGTALGPVGIPATSETTAPVSNSPSAAPGALAVDQGWSLHGYSIRPDDFGYFAATIMVANDTASARPGSFTLTITDAGRLIATLRGTVSLAAAHQNCVRRNGEPQPVCARSVHGEIQELPVMTEEIGGWATRLAEAVAPDEADLAPDIAAVFVAGGKGRAELFRTSAAVPGGFDAGAVLAIFPFVLSAVTAAGPAIQAFLGSGVTGVPGMVKDVMDLRDRYRHREAEPEKAAPESQRAYQALDRVFDVIEAELGKAGIEPDQRELLSYRIVRSVLDDLGGTREFLDAASNPPGR